MSGGSYDYLCYKIDEAANSIRSRHSGSPLHVAFAAHLDDVAKAMHDIEWVDSCDYAKGGDEESIRSVLGKGADQYAMQAATIMLADTIEVARKLLDSMREKGTP